MKTLSNLVLGLAVLLGVVAWMADARAQTGSKKETGRANTVMQDVSPNELKARLESWGYKVGAHEDRQERTELLVSNDASRGVDEYKGFNMRMFGCTPEDASFMERRCDGYEFRAFLRPGYPVKNKTYMDWNREFGQTRAFDTQGKPRLAWRVTIKGGVTWDNIRATVDLWEQELVAYFDHIDASVMD